MRLWVIAYDISDDHARGQVEHILLNHAERVQLSVFEGFFSTSALNQLRRMLLEKIDKETDSLRCYPVCQWCQDIVSWHGRGRRTIDAHYYIF